MKEGIYPNDDGLFTTVKGLDMLPFDQLVLGGGLTPVGMKAVSEPTADHTATLEVTSAEEGKNTLA